ncbi:hypothetical protein [Bacillus sp. USDA818B3_A]|uniref:hypothetical protein n=1 Tax=Bacillus sp. USDA818B3_A TaxID=2698834 RepID=UPI0019231FE9|nr:hypothetical protein [Bacillus sp. USDA818B3_A]
MDEIKKLKTKLKVEEKKNGSMAPNFDEVKKLGKEMKENKTGSELQENDNKDPDPLQ